MFDTDDGSERERGSGRSRDLDRGRHRSHKRDRDRSAVVADLRRKLDALGGGSGSFGEFAGAAGEEGKPSGGTGSVDSGGVNDGSSRVSIDGGDGVLAAPAPLAEVLPSGGVPRGSVVNVSSAAPGGGGATSLLLSLLAAASMGVPGAWIAVVGMPNLGILAASEMGVDLSRLGLVPDPGDDVAQVLSVLADGVDVIATVPPPRLPPARQRVLEGRLRQSGAVLLVAGRWPGADLAFTVREVRWSGIGQGHGRLKDRELDVQVAGRRSGAAMGAIVTLLLRATPQNSVIVEAVTSPPTVSGAPAARARFGDQAHRIG